MFHAFSIPYTKTALEHIGDAKCVLHICGNTTILLEHMMKTGVSGLSIEEKVSPEEAVKIVDGRVALVGNLVRNTIVPGHARGVQGCGSPMQGGRVQHRSAWLRTTS